MTDTIRDLKRPKELVAQMTTDFLATTADLADSLNCMNAWYIENSGNGVPELEALLRRCLAALAAAPLPLADTHYEWELEDAQGEWQAGGSSNSQSDVESEGMRYLQTYAQDGRHTLIIRQHTTQTINEITND